MTKDIKIKLKFSTYSKEDLMQMEPGPLRALLHERTHHRIEVPLYPVLLEAESRKISSFGDQAQLVFDVWRERGFPEDAPDIQWVKQYLDIAKKIRAGEKVHWEEPISTPFTSEEMEVVNKLIYERRSCREWIDKEVPDEMIEKILDAGRAAPNGCNLNLVRFIVIKDPAEANMVWSDISTENAVIIVICYDERSRQVVGQDRSVPQNAGFDAAAAADHMLLMAHALGLGGVWLTCTKDTAKSFKEQYGLPDYIEVALHIAIGWPAIGTKKSLRMPLEDMM
ncbi:MAG: nitroreductase family protein, partial [Deltaproteobacteria bacterium]|nr:nitroreductase family protein [Deltaproteobacteria bacterium]